VLIVGNQKGRDLKQRMARNFGQAKPEGYRKALRAMQLAAKFGRPIMVFIDTPGAYPGVDAEERGQAEAIAHNLREMARLPVPVIVTIYSDRSFEFILKSPPASVLLKQAAQIAIEDDNAPAGAGKFRSEPTHGVSNTLAVAGTSKCNHAAAGIAEQPSGQFGVGATAGNGGRAGEGRSVGREESYLRRCFFENRCMYAHFVVSLTWFSVTAVRREKDNRQK